MNNFNYTEVKNVEEGIQTLTTSADSNYIGGGTNLIDLMKYNITSSSALVDVHRINQNQSITELEGGGIRINGFMTNADTAWHPIIEARYPLLSKSILAGASAQIRNMATNAGNLLQRTRCYYFYDVTTACNKRVPGSGCSAIGGYNRMHAILGSSENCIAVFPSDMCVALAALDAVVNVEGPNGKRSIPFEDFHRLPGDTPDMDNNLQYGELIVSIDLPQKGFADNYSYLKLRDRNSYAFALISVATGLELQDGKIVSSSIALGGVAHKPWRMRDAEDFLQDKEPTREVFAEAAKLILRGAKGFGYNNFKIELAKRAIIRNCLMALQPSSQLPGAQPSESTA